MARRKTTLPNFFWTAPEIYYKQPVVTKGKDMPLPEGRKRVLDKIKANLKEAKGKAIRQDYSNGEFITSSFIIGPTFESISGRELELDVDHHEAHFDKKRKLWWRDGGFFD